MAAASRLRQSTARRSRTTPDTRRCAVMTRGSMRTGRLLQRGVRGQSEGRVSVQWAEDVGAQASQWSAAVTH